MIYAEDPAAASGNVVAQEVIPIEHNGPVSLSKQDQLLFANGYEPVVDHWKKPNRSEWATAPITLESLAEDRKRKGSVRAKHEGKQHEHYGLFKGTALRTGGGDGKVLALDIDPLPPEGAVQHIGGRFIAPGYTDPTEALTDMIAECFPSALGPRFGSKGCAYLVRCDTPVESVTIVAEHPTLKSDVLVRKNGQLMRKPVTVTIEILGNGRKISVYGPHVCGKNYRWPLGQILGEPAVTPRADLPVVTTGDIERLVGALKAKLTELGYTIVEDEKKRDKPRDASGIRSAGERQGHPVPREYLERMLALFDPSVCNEEWWPRIAQIRATPIAEVEPARMDDVALDICDKWSSGVFWPDGEPNNYDWNAVHDCFRGHPPKEGGYTFGTLYQDAVELGWTEPAPGRSTRKTASEIFEAAAKHTTGVKDGSRARHLRRADQWLDDPKPAMVVDGLIPDKRLIMPWGDTGCGKTYWALEIATAIVMGRPAFGHFQTKGGGVAVIFAGEDADYLVRSRLAAIERKFPGTMQRVFVCDRAIPLQTDNLRAEYEAELKLIKDETGERIAIIVNDTLTRSLEQLNQKDGETANKFNRVMEDLVRAYACPVIVTAHQPKSGPEGGVRGAQGFMDNCPVAPHIVGAFRPGTKQLQAITCRWDGAAKFRIGRMPDEWTADCEDVTLGEEYGGNTTDLVLHWRVPSARTESAVNVDDAHDTAEIIRRVLLERTATTRATGLSTETLKGVLVNLAVQDAEGSEARRTAMDEAEVRFGQFLKHATNDARGGKPHRACKPLYHRKQTDGGVEIKWYVIEEQE